MKSLVYSPDRLYASIMHMNESGKRGEIFDMGIIGGGIAGAAIARDASLRGLSVALFEKNTFGSGTSSKSSNLIHGGFRYLEISWKALKKGSFGEAWKNFRFVFLSLREAQILEKIAPQWVKPLPLVVPIYESDARKRWQVYAGSLIYGMLALITGTSRMPKILWTVDSVLRLIPDLNPRGLTGGVAIWDRHTDDLNLVRATLESAVRAGTRAFEQAGVTAYRFNPDSSLFELSVSLQNRTTIFRSKKLINASGPWVDKTRSLGSERDDDYLVPLAGSHITLRKFLPVSVLLQAVDHRFFFVVNAGETSRVGTTERFFDDPDTVEATEREIKYLLRSLQHYFPNRSFTRNDVLGHDAGIRPLARPSKETKEDEISREHKVRIGSAGVFHVIGVKLTDHRRAAEEVVNLVADDLLRREKRRRRKSRTRQTPLQETEKNY